MTVYPYLVAVFVFLVSAYHELTNEEVETQAWRE